MLQAFAGVQVLGHRSVGQCLGITLPLVFATALQAQVLSESGSGAASPGTLDCTEVAVDYLNDPNLTREERIALMDRALMKSLNQFDACQTARNGSAGNSGSGGSGGGAGSNAGSGSGSGATSGQKSFAAQDMTGTETAPADASPQTEMPGTAAQASAQSARDGVTQSETRDSASTQAEAARALDNGKVPEDIPPADNDSVLEAQIRRAAINEKDPEIQKRLWNEYRKYKGLPQVM